MKFIHKYFFYFCPLISSPVKNTYSLNADLSWTNEIKDEESIKEYTKSFESEKEQVIATVPPGYNAEINSSNIDIKSKNYI